MLVIVFLVLLSPEFIASLLRLSLISCHSKSFFGLLIFPVMNIPEGQPVCTLYRGPQFTTRPKLNSTFPPYILGILFLHNQPQKHPKLEQVNYFFPSNIKYTQCYLIKISMCLLPFTTTVQFGQKSFICLLKHLLKRSS